MAVLTRLMAVNQLLSAIGESPIVQLESGVGETATAEAVLDEFNRRVQARGWQCNTESNVTLNRDTATSEVHLGSDVLRVDPVDESLDYVQRGTRLYDRAGRTYVFTKDPKVHITRLLDFEDLPFDLANRVVKEAAVAFQQRHHGSKSLDAFAKEDMANAIVDADDAESLGDDYNILDNIDVAPLHWRNRRYRRY